VKVMQINKREGGFCKMERVRCFSWPILASHGDGERRRYFGEDIFGGEDILVEENGRMEKVGEFGGRKRKERKRKKKKKLEKGRYFLGSESENNESGGFPGFSCGCGKLSGKYRNRPEIKYLGTTRKNSQKSRILF